MGKTPRERLLMLLLPAIIVAGGYLLGYARDKELTTARAGLAAARVSAVSHRDVLDQREKVAAAQTKLAEIKKEKVDLDARWKQLGLLHEREPEVRVDSLRRLSKVLWDCGLHSFEESLGEDGAGDLPPSFQSALNQVKGNGAAQGSRRLWKIRFVGRYADVLEALETLRDSGSPVVPIGISMSETRADTPYRLWTLLLWI